MKSYFHILAVILGIVGSLLAVLAVAVYEGYLPLADVDNLTSGELGSLSALSFVGAIGFALAERSE